jgi:hypothetical protein
LFAARAASAVPCRPAIDLIADESTKSLLRDELLRRGLSTDASGPCGSVRAWVEREGASIIVRLQDDYGRRDARKVASDETAASLIEAWARSDLIAPAIEPAVIEDAPRRVPLHPDEPQIATAVAMAKDEQAERIAPFDATVAAEGYIDNMGALWVGGGASAWFKIGAVYLGPTARFLSMSRTQDQTMFAPKGTTIEGLASAELPIAIGAMLVRPGVGLGAAWSSMVWEPGERFRERLHHTEHAAIAPRANLHLALLVPMTESLGLDVHLSADFAPYALAERVENGFDEPAEPWFMAGLGLGLSWEAF